ncbi:nucleotide disphospho-sugar-binding domain-containing protein [Nonomuraea fastidiosa]|uniref:nucleotide disphospho-sugar-binding domain-containing protein n=1 Tax=Nonomuraea fastidiosa TaxID=46173 RepID=UPI00366B22F9
MRVLFTTWAWPSHFYPMVSIAWALRTAGHDVRIASQPALMDTIMRAGLPAVVTGADFDIVGYHRRELASLRVEQQNPPGPADWDAAKRRRVQKSFAQFVEIARLMAGDLLTFAQTWRPDLIVHDPLTYAGPLVARLLGVPSARNLFGPDFTYDTRHLEAEAMAPLLAEYGVSDLDTVGRLTIDPCPPGLQYPADIPRRLVRYVPYNGLSRIPDWLLEKPDKRRICVIWGTTTTKFSQEHAMRLPFVVDAVASMGTEVVLAVTPDQLELFDSMPDGVRVADSVPLDVLLPTCDAIVHQGGAGTTLNSALHGVPQLMVVQTPDQVVNAIPVERSGAGTYLVPKETSRDSVLAHAAKVLDDPSCREAAHLLRAQMLEQPPPSGIVADLERFAREGTAS